MNLHNIFSSKQTNHIHKVSRLFLRSILVSFSVFICAIGLSGCGYERIAQNPSLGETGEYYSSEDLSTLFDSFCMSVFQEEMAQANTLDLHYTLQHPETYEIYPQDVSLGSYDLQTMIENHAAIKELKAKLLTFDRNELTDSRKITFDAFLETLNTQLMAEGLELYEQPLAPTIGVQAQLPILLAEYAFSSISDVEDYLTLLEGIDEYYKDILIFEQQKADAGLAPSDASIDAILTSCKSYLFDSPDNFLTDTFQSRLKNLEEKITITDFQKKNWIQRHELAITDHFLPAYQLLINGMSELKGRGLNDGGLAGFQDGAKFYEYLVKSGSGVSYSVPELKAALFSQMEQNMADMNRLYHTYPDLDARMASASSSLTNPQDILEDLKRQMVSDFPILPDCDYEISYVPAALEDVLSPAFYLTAPIDNMDQNVIYINRAYTDSASTLYTTLAHEGFPGHLYQTVYSRKSQSEIPLRSVLSCSGANEGWATYVEHYANFFDHGLPDGVGEYHALLRSYSLCVHGILDIGINYEGWNKETSDAFVSSCFQVDQTILDELWQVMIDNPTNYLDYCGGFVEFMEMRKEAEETLGEAFSPLDFHQFLLDIGPVPFSVIRTHFADWLEQNSLPSK